MSSSGSTLPPFAEWNPAGAPFPIRYSQSLLQQIDFFVGDGYRRIPHGGLEVGGLLYGPVEDGVLKLVSHAPIECQHSLGPSFVLSTTDIEQLREQIRKPFRDQHVELPVAGWFVSHCRGELAMTQQEVDLFAELFPARHSVTLLVKPEKLRATQYGFLVRSSEGNLTESRCRATFLLPLTMRPEGAGTDTSSVISRRVPRQTRNSRGAPTVEAGTSAPAAATPANVASAPSESGSTTAGVISAPIVPPQPEPNEPPAARTDEKQSAGNTGAHVEEHAVGEPGEVTRTAVAEEDEHEEIEEVEPPSFGIKPAKPPRTAMSFRVEVGLAAALAILLLVGVVWTYLAFLLPPIPLAAETRGGKVVVTWPAGATAGASSPWLGTWVDGSPSARSLTTEEQERGSATLEASGADVIVQLRVHHWLYERQGLIRLIQVPPASARRP